MSEVRKYLPEMNMTNVTSDPGPEECAILSAKGEKPVGLIVSPEEGKRFKLRCVEFDIGTRRMPEKAPSEFWKHGGLAMPPKSLDTLPLEELLESRGEDVIFLKSER